MKAKSNPGWVVSFSTCNEWAWRCITGLLKLQHICMVAGCNFHYSKSIKLLSESLGCAAVHSHFALILRMFPPMLPSLPGHSAVSSSPFFSTWCNHRFLQATFSVLLHPGLVPSIPPHPPATHALHSCFCVTTLCNSCFLPSSLWSQLQWLLMEENRLFDKQGVFYTAVWSTAMREIPGC